MKSCQSSLQCSIHTCRALWTSQLILPVFYSVYANVIWLKWSRLLCRVKVLVPICVLAPLRKQYPVLKHGWNSGWLMTFKLSKLVLELQQVDTVGRPNSAENGTKICIRVPCVCWHTLFLWAPLWAFLHGTQLASLGVMKCSPLL